MTDPFCEPCGFPASECWNPKFCRVLPSNEKQIDNDTDRTQPDIPVWRDKPINPQPKE